jgi:diguanylate cyclase (GGDEF)-like protein
LTDLQPLESVADICAAVIRNAQHVEQLNNLAVRDGLTGIFNRRYFEHRILEEIERAGRYETALALVMIDIDGFKKLNDEFGHLLGDEVLRMLAVLLTQQLRKADVVCRYGGEEFAVLLPEITVENASSVADKLRRVVEAFPFPGVPRPVTMSCGVARFPDNGATRDELVKAADAALYNAKQSGRNRVSKAAAGGVFY